MIVPILLFAAAVATALVAAVTLFAGSGFASGSAAQANYAPTNTSPPTIKGTPQVDQTLTATTGTWSYQSTPTYTFQWQRCDSAGKSCGTVTGSSASAAYKVVSADTGHTLRVVVTAHDAQGSTAATSAQTGVVAAAGVAGAIKLSDGRISVPASSIALPDRLVVDGIQYQPRTVQGRSPVLARFHVSDTEHGYVVRDALVYALGIPYAWVTKGVEVRTDQAGWATLNLTPSPTMPRRGALMVFVRARVEGQKLLAGTSTRRLSQILIRR